MSKVKALCKWEKDAYEKKIDKLMAIVENSKYVCPKCGRSANDKKYLCKTEKLKQQA